MGSFITGGTTKPENSAAFAWSEWSFKSAGTKKINFDL